ncbi:MAG TPA: hypothetical protein VJ653_02825 [Acidimicrobiales bacterium]|nr:hypothetical protein [Acidimicrobiales bacterium]
MDRKTLESVAVENAHLRGLFALPLGGLMVLSAFGNWQWGALANAWVFGAAALALLATCLPLARYYDEHYGRVTPSTRQRNRAAVAVAISVPLVFVGSLLLSSRASWSLDWPVNPTAVSFALVMFVAYAMSIGVRAHHVLVFGTLLIVGFLPVWEREGASGNAGLAIAGVAVMVAGVLDHRLLVRTFGPPAAAGTEAMNAGA